MSEYEQKSWDLLGEFTRITPHIIMRRFKLTMDFAKILCQKIWVRQNKEARELQSKLELEWKPQLDKVKLNNLEKIRRKRK